MRRCGQGKLRCVHSPTIRQGGQQKKRKGGKLGGCGSRHSATTGNNKWTGVHSQLKGRLLKGIQRSDLPATAQKYQIWNCKHYNKINNSTNEQRIHYFICCFTPLGFSCDDLLTPRCISPLDPHVVFSFTCTTFLSRKPLPPLILKTQKLHKHKQRFRKSAKNCFGDGNGVENTKFCVDDG